MTCRIAILVVAIMVFAPVLWSESTDCGTPVIIIPDGRVTPSTIASNATYWYGIYAADMHSYAIEFEAPADNFISVSKPQFSSLVVYGPNDSLQGCRGTSSMSTTPNSGNTPVIRKNSDGSGRRVSFIAWTSGLYLIAVTNLSNAGNYTFRAVDTTLFNTRWTSFSGYTNQWVFLNRSDQAITGIFVLYDLKNRPLLAMQVALPASGVVVRYSDPSDLNLPGNLSGYGVFSHNGAGGAVSAEVYMISQTGAQVIHSKFDGAGPN